MFTYKSYCNIAPSYVCELISRRESSLNMRLGAYHHQLIMISISKERSFIYAAPCEWNKLSEYIRTSNVDSFRYSVKTMLFTQQYGRYCYVCCNYCNWIVLLYSPLNSYLYVHWILDFK